MSPPNPKPYRRAASRVASFQHAFEGWWYVLRTQPNARIHAFISIGVFLLGLWLKLSRIEWAIIFVMTALVWIAEFTNTALEAAVDLASPGPHPLAKAAKDVAAAAVLVDALAAVIVGLLILGPPLWAKVITLLKGVGL